MRKATRSRARASSGHVCERCKKAIRSSSQKKVFLFHRQLPTDREQVEVYVCSTRCLDAYNYGPDAGYDQDTPDPPLSGRSSQRS